MNYVFETPYVIVIDGERSIGTNSLQVAQGLYELLKEDKEVFVLDCGEIILGDDNGKVEEK